MKQKTIIALFLGAVLALSLSSAEFAFASSDDDHDDKYEREYDDDYDRDYESEHESEHESERDDDDDKYEKEGRS